MRKLFFLLIACIFSAGISLKAQLNLPQISSGGDEYWYYIYYPEQARVITASGDESEKVFIQPPVYGGTEEQLWKVEVAADGNYIFTNKKGAQLYRNKNEDKYYSLDLSNPLNTLTADTLSTFKFDAYTGSTYSKDITLLVKDVEGSYINRVNGGVDKYALQNYGSTSDSGSAIQFLTPEQLFTIYPKISSGADEHWYYMYYPEQSRAMTALGDGEKVFIQPPVNSGAENQLWKVEVAGDGNYIFTNKEKAQSLYFGDPRYYSSKTSTPSTFKIEGYTGDTYSKDNTFVVKRINSDGTEAGHINRVNHNSDGDQYALQNWRSTSDTGSAIQFLSSEQLFPGFPKVSTTDAPTWYQIQVKGSDTDRNDKVLSLSDEASGFRIYGAGQMFSEEDELNKQLWRFENSDGNFKIINRFDEGKSVSIASWEEKTISVAVGSSTPKEWELIPSTNISAGYYLIKDAAGGNEPYLHQANNYGGREFVVMTTGSGYGTGMDSQFRFVKFGSPSLAANPASVNFPTVLTGSNPDQIQLTVTGSYLEADISYEIEGADKSKFSVAPTEGWNARIGGVLNISLLPPLNEEAEYTATLILKSTGAEEKTVTLTAKVQQAPVTPVAGGWYYMNWYRSGYGNALKDNGLGEMVKNVPIEAGSGSQIWKLVEAENDRVQPQSLAGHVLELNGANPNRVVAKEKSSVTYELVSNPHYVGLTAYALIYSGSQHLDHVNSNPNKDCLGTWGIPDGDGAAIMFYQVPDGLYAGSSDVGFGLMSISENPTQTLNILGIGLGSDITVSPVSGEGAAAYTVTQSADWDALTGGTLEIKFKPVGDESYPAVITITSDTYSANINLTGEGTTKPIITVDEALIDMGTATLNMYAPGKDLTVSGVLIQDHIAYEIVNDPDGVFEVVEKEDWTPTGGGTLHVTGKPKEVKSYTAELVFTTTNGDEKRVPLQLTGETVELPVIVSDDLNEVWYYINFERGNAYIQNLGINRPISNRASADNDAQLWKVVTTGITGQYQFVNKANRNKFSYTASALPNVKADRFYTSPTSDYTFKFVKTSNEKWVIYCNELKSNINKTGSSVDWEFCQYSYTNDTGNYVNFIQEDQMTEYKFPRISTETESYWYQIEFERNVNAPNGLIIQQNGLGSDLKAADKKVGELSQYWKILGSDGNYVITDYYGYNVKLVDGVFKVVNGTGDLFEILPVRGGNYEGSLFIKRKETSSLNGFNPKNGSYIGHSIAEFGMNDGGTALKFFSTMPRNNADLSSLTVSVGTLDSRFFPSILSYMVELPYSIEEITIEGKTVSPFASLTGEGTFNLVVGDNKLSLIVSSEDGSVTKEYEVNVVRQEREKDATLASISLSKGELSPNFQSTINEYVLVMQNSLPLSLDGIPSISEASVLGTVDSELTSLRSTSSEIILGEAGCNNVVLFTVTSEDGSSTSTYKITINPLPDVLYSDLGKLIDVNLDETLALSTINVNPKGGRFEGNGVFWKVFDPTGLDAGQNTITYYYEDPVSGCSSSCEISLNVIYPKIDKIISDDLQEVLVKKGTTETEVISQLPTSVRIFDNKGKEYTIPLTWIIEGYDENMEGTYTAKGQFELPSFVSQSSPEKNLFVTTAIVVESGLSLETIDANEVKIYPNPSKGLIYISAKEDSEFSITDMSGRLLKQGVVISRNPVSLNLSSGIYLVRIKNDTNITTHRVVIQK